jgi:hypothetical protein
MTSIGTSGIATDLTHTSPRHKVGERTRNIYGQWEYVHANGAISQYDFVVVDKDGEAAALTTTNATSNNMKVGVAQVAFADNAYGWVWRGDGGWDGGAIYGQVINYTALNNINTTATAGTCDDAATTLVRGVVGLDTVGGTEGPTELVASTLLYVN